MMDLESLFLALIFGSPFIVAGFITGLIMRRFPRHVGRYLVLFPMYALISCIVGLVEVHILVITGYHVLIALGIYIGFFVVSFIALPIAIITMRYEKKS